ncbi:hypothetical protein BH10CYA1_BH10CYA1_44160 [soil metagenome]
MEQSNSTDENMQSGNPQSERVYTPEQIVELNKDLQSSAITLYLKDGYDKRLLPAKAQHLRNWWEEDAKTRMHARFCLPITMASGLGFYILSPATFTVQWDGDHTHDAKIEIIDASSHTVIDTDSAHGSFTVQSSFIACTKNLGDFVYVKGIANFVRLPYSVMEEMIESWWNPSEFGIVCLLNQPGQFTIKKGEPLAQMFVLNSEHAEYGLGTTDGYPPIWPDWKVKQEGVERNLDYFRGLLPNGTPVCPHFKSWAEATIGTKADSELTVDDYIDAGVQAEKNRNYDEALRQYQHAQNLAESTNQVTERLVDILRRFAMVQQSIHKYDLSVKLLLTCINFNQRYLNSEFNWTADIYDSIALSYRMLNDREAAAKHYENALQAKRKNGAHPLDLAETLLDLGTLSDSTGKFERAAALFEEARIILERDLPLNDAKTLFLKNGMAILLTNQKKFEEAAKIYEELIEIRSKKSGENSLDMAATFNDFAFHYKARKDLEKSEQLFKKAIAIKAEILGADNLQVAEAHEQLAWIYRDSGRLAEAIDELKQALEGRRKNLPANDAIVKQNYRLLGDVYLDLGETELGSQAHLNARNA